MIYIFERLVAFIGGVFLGGYLIYLSMSVTLFTSSLAALIIGLITIVVPSFYLYRPLVFYFKAEGSGFVDAFVMYEKARFFEELNVDERENLTSSSMVFSFVTLLVGLGIPVFLYLSRGEITSAPGALLIGLIFAALGYQKLSAIIKIRDSK